MESSENEKKKERIAAGQRKSEKMKEEEVRGRDRRESEKSVRRTKDREKRSGGWSREVGGGGNK